MKIKHNEEPNLANGNSKPTEWKNPPSAAFIANDRIAMCKFLQNSQIALTSNMIACENYSLSLQLSP